MPIREQVLLRVAADDSFPLIGFNCELSFAADVREVGGDGTDLCSAAGDFHHDLGDSSDGSLDLMDLSGRETAGWSDASEAE